MRYDDEITERLQQLILEIMQRHMTQLSLSVL